MKRRLRFTQTYPSSYNAERARKQLFANIRMLPLSELPTKKVDRYSRLLRLAEDRRTYHPDKMARTAATFFGRRALRLLPSPVRKTQRAVAVTGKSVYELYTDPETVPSAFRFAQPKNIPICVRRKIRREVLHAFRIAGKTGLGAPHYNEYSKVTC